MNIYEIAAMGREAEAFRESDTYQRAYERVYLNILQGIVDAQDDETVLKLKAHITSLEAIDHQISNIIDDGEVAKAEIEGQDGN